jgi:hypothetical protein
MFEPLNARSSPHLQQSERQILSRKKEARVWKITCVVFDSQFTPFGETHTQKPTLK